MSSGFPISLSHGSLDILILYLIFLLLLKLAPK
jgi:hypothetical protein